DAGIRVAVGVAEPAPVPGLGHGTPLQAPPRRPRWGRTPLHKAPETPQALERVAPPGAVVDPRSHRVAVLTVVGQIDAGLELPAYDLDGRVAQFPLVVAVVLRRLVHARAVHLDEMVRARKAPSVADSYAIDP